jgi:long-chain acyl-CoA synthetase
MYSWRKDQAAEIGQELWQGSMISVYQHRPHTLLVMLEQSANRFPEKVALTDGKIQMTYKEFFQKVDSLAGLLIENFSIKKGQRVALLMKNTLGFCLGVFAALKAGAIVVPLNTKLQLMEWETLVSKAAPVLLIAGKEEANKIRKHPENFPLLIEEKNFLSLEESNLKKRATPFPPLFEDDSAFILFTSGTTGKPKGAVLNHFNVIHACITFELCYELTSDDSTIIGVPIFHGTGLFAQFMPFLYLGGTIVLLNTFNPEKALELSEKYQITHMIAVPTMYTLFMNVMEHKPYHLNFRVLGSGGAPLPHSVLTKLTKWLPGVTVINSYGLTEATSPAVLMPREKIMDKHGSIGIPSPTMECAIVDIHTGKLADIGQPGELWLKGALIMKEYWKNHEATELALKGNWLKTGDVAIQDEDGFLYLKDRIKDIVNRGGEKVYCIEVEDVLYNHPKVMEATIVSIPDAIYGEVVKAVIVPKKNEVLTKEEIIEWASKFLAKYKVPTIVEFASCLPRNAGGKVIKKALKEELFKGGL